MNKYDIVIIGGGISGIYTMYNLKKKYPNYKILLLEKENRFGGRIYTYIAKINNIEYKMDLGAGRLGFHHERIIKLLNELNLNNDIISISNTETYIEYDKKSKTSYDKSNVKKIVSNLLYKFFNSKFIEKVPNDILKKVYISTFLKKIFSNLVYKNIENTFEYKSKLKNLNAYDAVKYFKYDYNKYSNFFVLKNGLNTIIDKMIENINKNKNYSLKKNAEVKKISWNSDTKYYRIEYFNRNNDKNIIINTEYIISALPRINLIKFNILNPYRKYLDTINEISKVRIFEIYDTNNGDVWFKNIKKTVTNNELQFVIPINSSNGLIMSSYNENYIDNENFWLTFFKSGERKLKKVLREKLMSIYNVFIPESNYIKFYYWKMGVAAWKKNVDSYFISQKILNIMPNFYICGENYSTYQAWCEGALQTSDEVLNLISCKLDKIDN